MDMRPWLHTPLLLGAILLLAACGSSGLDRTASGAGIGALGGAAAGALFGGLGAIPGAAIGAGAGAVTGFVTTPGQISLGEPIWSR